MALRGDPAIRLASPIENSLRFGSFYFRNDFVTILPEQVNHFYTPTGTGRDAAACFRRPSVPAIAGTAC